MVRLLLILFLCVGSARAAAPTVVNGMGARVGRTVLTVQDAYFFRALERFISGAGDPFEPEKGEALRKTMQKLIFEEMVWEEMKSLRVEGLTRPEAEARLRAARAKRKEATWKRLLKRFGKSEAEVVDRYHKSLHVETFLQKKVETMTPIITQTEIERYYQQNQNKLKGESLESLRPSISVLLKKQRMERALEEWIRFLRDKYGVVNHLDGAG